jgi:(1->4)-alpha-D-glucan 1-alpha-D-glucosylmutase
MRPRATYRLQLRQGVDLRQARALLPYLARLGASHLYLSPVLAAREGSAHGYDVVDPTRLDPALGDERELARLASTARRHGIDLLIDFVPNHMAASPDGPAFADVLTHGPAARHAPWFDVQWDEHGDTHAPLRLPVLGRPLPRAIADGGIHPVRRAGRIALQTPGRVLPLDPATLPTLLAGAPRALRRDGGEGDASALETVLRPLRRLPPRRAEARDERGPLAEQALASLADALRRRPAIRRAVDAELDALAQPEARRRLLRLVRAQPYRLAGWKEPGLLNYRRFFDINELIALRVEDPAVFDAVHATLLAWIERGWVGGLRLDHVDGLRDPASYLRRLRRAVDARWPTRERGPFPIYVEKILAPGERLPRAWPVQGTTGYEFLADIESTLIEPEGAAALERGWRAFTGRPDSFHATALRAKRLVLGDILAPDLERLVPLAQRALGDVGGPSAAGPLREALRELIVHLPVYRTYADGRGRLSASDRRWLRAALAGARDEGLAPADALDALEHLLLTGSAGDGPRSELLARLQQVTGPAAAKGVEDTALYAHVPLASRNEVGAEPDRRLDEALPDLHAAARAQRRRHPDGLLAVSTHDTKRSADLRARLDVLSEMPEAWLEAVGRWRRWNRRHRRRIDGRPAPDPVAEWLFYQTLAGLWPARQDTGAGLPDADELESLRERSVAYLEKASREAKERTRWIDPQLRYERALRRFVEATMDPSSPFLADFARVAERLVQPGIWNSLSRTLVQLTSPGVPDLYQGDELLQLTLVDPDNRRPVDFSIRRRTLAAIERSFDAGGRTRSRLLAALRERPEDGRLKLHLIARTCALRRDRPAVFDGSYAGLRARGEAAAHVIAFARGDGRDRAIAVAPRLTLALAEGRAPIGDAVWGGTTLRLPAGAGTTRFRCALSGRRVDAREGRLAVAEILAELPVALLVSARGPAGRPRRGGARAQRR